jgi:hypothetical protein
MIIPAEIKRLLTEIRRLGREIGIDPRYIADFNRLYRFYMEMEGPGPDEQREEPDTAPRPPDQENVRQGTAPPELQTYLDEVATARAKYAQRMEYYLLLKSFYNAFIFPLEQNVSIAHSCQALGIEAIGFKGSKKITQQELEAFRSGATEQVLGTMRGAFAAIGQVSFPDNFSAADFTSNNPDQTRADG